MIFLAVALCMLIAFVFAGIETGILSINRVRLHHRVKLGDADAARLHAMLEHRERMLLTVLLVTNFMNICAIILATQQAVRLFGKTGYAIAILVYLPLYLLGFELLPKSLFRRFPYRSLVLLIEPLRLASLVLSPIVALGEKITALILKKTDGGQRKLFAAREDFKYFAIESERSGALTKTEREMIHNIVDFRAVTVREVMLPREKIHVVRGDAPLSELLSLSRKTDIDRLPITDASGRIAGIVNVFETLLEFPSDPAERARFLSNSVGAFQRRILKIMATAPAYTAIRRLRAARSHVAIVTDENDTQLGIVTIEDLVKRLVSSAQK